MSEGPRFIRDFDPQHGHAVRVAEDIIRVTAANPGPFTFHGTNSYIVGTGELAVIDPGPDDPAHLAALVRAIAGRPVRAILLTHTHKDHSMLTESLRQLTGAATYAEGPHRTARVLALGETNPLDASADHDFRPDIVLGAGSRVEAEGWTIEAVATPGHTANHLAFALAGRGILFSGDHVMAWSTSIVAPPDGSMADYMASLDRLLARPESLYLSGHGPALPEATAFVADLKAHRRAREAEILKAVAAGFTTIPDLVPLIYPTLAPQLHPAAALSILAHMEDLGARGLVVGDGQARMDGRFEVGC